MVAWPEQSTLPRTTLLQINLLLQVTPLPQKETNMPGDTAREGSTKKTRLYRSSQWMVNLLTEINFEPRFFVRPRLIPRRNFGPTFLRLDVARCNRGWLFSRDPETQSLNDK